MGIRELKNNLSRYLKRVQAGERVLVTDRGRTVAELRPPEPEGDIDQPHMATYNRLIREGVLRPGRGGDPFANWPPTGTLKLPQGAWEEWLDWTRQDKWP